MNNNLLLVDYLVEKGGPGSGRYPAGSGKDSELHSTREKDIPTFVSAFLGQHTSGAAAKEYLKTVSDDKLKTAAKLISGHLDSASGLVRNYIHAEASRRGLKL